ncbi:LPXTG cell wall anchor domain-containing protein [Granulicatella adiacens]|uniref:LPXTG cell wall anchor domain-containing protein n=1 Tax=Granulicatella adiacens TaxID=46124 RepID=UPI001C3D0177|nr:LPXTG cell wall anchor domain-containing protein [Granulicatella adiacens]MCT2160086.1 LPXTG cell wall anchor domain-containing protein [Granulicatella adiacens]
MKFLFIVALLLGWFGYFTNNVFAEEIQKVNFSNLTEIQKANIQQGEYTELGNQDRILLVYAYDKGACQLPATLPNTGTNSNVIFMTLGVLVFTSAGYFVFSNKKHKNIVLTIGLILSGALATSATISASEFTQEESCYKYIGYIRENVLVEATTETASSESDEEVTVETTTTETTTTETTTTVQTTEAPTTEATTTVSPVAEDPSTETTTSITPRPFPPGRGSRPPQ